MEKLIKKIQEVLPPTSYSLEKADFEKYGRDWTRFYAVKPSVIAFPRSIEELQKIVLIATETKTPMVPSGGRTGLSGAAVASHGEIVVSLEKMNGILEFNESNLTLTCQAGAITEDVQNKAKQLGYFFPIDFASRGSSQIGGNIATNAGGIKVLRYGLMRDWVVGLKVVTAAGQVVEFNRSLIKNATGYDLRHLFIGSEGTLGFIAEATLKLAPQPKRQTVILLALPSNQFIMDVFQKLRKNLPLSAFEFFTDKALKHVLNSHSSLHQPFQEKHPCYVLAEFDDLEENISAANNCLEEFLETEKVSDGLLSQSENQLSNFWKYRELISESLSSHTPYKNDISVTIEKTTAFMSEANKIIESKYPDFEVVWFGHIGDGNLHINILRPTNMNISTFVEKCRTVDDDIYALVKKFGGSISAEHGVGLTKKKFLHYSKSNFEIETMRAIKKIFDPHNLMNPGKIFDE